MLSDAVVTMLGVVVGVLFVGLGLMAVLVVLGQAILVARRTRALGAMETKPPA